MTTRLDLRGLKCPLPVLKTRKAMAMLGPDEALEVLSDDPFAGVDVPNAVREAGNALVGRERMDAGWLFSIRKTDPG